MKPVCVASLVLAVSVCAALTAQAQSSRSPAERSSADSKARELSVRNPSTADGSQALAASAVIFGSIGTAATGGAPVQVFTRRADVFVTAGPTATPCFFPAYLSDGKYYFQVTDPSGRSLLSTDTVSERAFTVKGGVIATYDGTTHTTDGKTACGSLAISLSPYSDAGARKALYIAWVTPAAAFDGNPTQVDPVCGTGCFHGFHTDLSLTTAFRVEDKPSCDDSFCISGVAFNDANGNGVRDSGEAGLAGVPIKIENATGLVLTGLTAADGSFQICGLASGEDFKVTSPAPLGFTNSGPANGVIAQRLFAKDFAYIIQVCMNNVPNLLFPNAPIPGSIGGVKFQDTNANGVRDPGEPTLAGVTITLTPSGGGTPQTKVTAADGSFLFTGLAAGTYVLTEMPPTGFTQTLPASGGITIVLPANGSSVSNLFGNFNGILTGTISGAKFNDVNGNGVQDPGEPSLAGVTINLSSFPSCVPPPAPLPPGSLTPIASTVTASDGSFNFANVALGCYILSEVVPAGFKQTLPTVIPPLQGSYFVSVTVSQRSVTGLLFGNQALAVFGSISGTKFNDANGNGVRDSGEAGVSNVTINLAGPGGLTRTTTTDASGNFTFSNLPSGTFTISEVVPVGSVQTTPGGAGTISVTLAAGQNATGSLFGNRAAIAGSASISGTKFLDINANGVVDGIDRGFEGVTITLKDSSGNTQTTVSAADGTFKFVNLAPGTYTLSEVIPPGFAQTFPGTPDVPKSFTITLTAGQQAAGFIFLNKC